MNRLYYVWTEGHMGATGEAPSGPIRLEQPILAANKGEAWEKAEALLTSWHGPIKKVTTDEDYAPRRRYEW